MSILRARDLGIPFEGIPGLNNAITDLAGVEVGYTTLIAGEDTRTGVTIIHPRGRKNHDPVFSGWHILNGNGEMTGAAWVEESGFLEGPIGITNTHSLGTVRDAIIQWQVKNHALFQSWSCPLVAETADGRLNNMNGFYIKPEHAWTALDGAHAGPLDEGNVGGGTGMTCYEFKGGTGTSSRKLSSEDGGYTIGVLSQTNFGLRSQLTISGVPVGTHLMDYAPLTPLATPKREQGSLIVMIGTDAPLLPHQLKRLARRGPLGMARTGGLSGNSSGDIFLAFSTANPSAAQPASGNANLLAIPNDHMDSLFRATVYAVEESIINSLVAAKTMTGRNGLTVSAVPHEKLQEIMRRYNRLDGVSP